MKTLLAALLAASLTISAISAVAQGTTSTPEPKITEGYARMVARDAYFWAWPMLNVYNRRLAFKDVPEPGLQGGIVPIAPPNRLAMLSDYVQPEERLVACPNQDVVYGASTLALDESPVVIQVPDFGKRFWVYQIVDVRTDSFADLGAMYGTKPGFYMLVGPNWKGTVPKGITKVFRSSTNTGFVVPRIFMDDTPEDKRAVQPFVNAVDMYPLSQFDGKMKHRVWADAPKFPAQATGDAETKWVDPAKFVDELPLIMKDAPPLPGEQARYKRITTVLAAAQRDPAIKQAMIDEAGKTDSEVIQPLFELRNFGIPLPDNWGTIDNGAMFGTDYLTRTAVAKSNIFVNKPNETKYFYQDLDASGGRLNGANRYTLTFKKGALPPVRGFWSLTLYNTHHFFEPNALKRYSLGTKNKSLKPDADGSLTIYIQADSPGADHESNWLPAPKDADFSLYVRAYWPEQAITSGKWTPPAVVKAN
ncbi:DUF1254 domain-containing protein [Pararobbsia alpina]|uniref:DUF1254 domain-containing protein n=1 Tax=Pararobbsia alpina TaxID=621374 RepID=UPI0039A6B937